MSYDSTNSSFGLPPLAASKLANRYLIHDTARAGTTGWVLKARDQDVDIEVAIKILSPSLLETDEERERFVEAVRQCRSVHHVNVVRIHDVGIAETQVYYTMPYLESLSLRQVIDLRTGKGSVFTLAEVLPLANELGQALAAIAEHGPHGALRPSNVTMLPEMLKLTGLPHHRGLPRQKFVSQQQQHRMLEYLAPEARRDGVVDPRADVYSLGVIVCEMLTGTVYAADGTNWPAVC